MPIRDFMPLPPWEGPPIPSGLTEVTYEALKEKVEGILAGSFDLYQHEIRDLHGWLAMANLARAEGNLIEARRHVESALSWLEGVREQFVRIPYPPPDVMLKRAEMSWALGDFRHEIGKWLKSKRFKSAEPWQMYEE